MKRTTLGFISLLCLSAASCNVQALLDSLGAQEGLSALLTSLEAQPSEALERGDTEFRGLGGSVVDVSTPCLGGGTIGFHGNLEVSDVDAGDIDPTDVDPSNPVDPGSLVPTIKFDYTVKLDGCQVEGVTIDGEFTYAMASSWDDATQSMDFSWTYEGSVDFSGSVEGPCDFRFDAGGEGEAADWFDARPATFSGDACGHDATEVLQE